MTDKKVDLCVYRMQNAVDTLGAANLCMQNKFYKDVINRSYYAAFYAVKAVLALEEKDFNQTYVATGIFSKEIGKKLGRLKKERESSDYDDFYIASLNEATEQMETAKMIVQAVQEYLIAQGIGAK